MAATPPDMDPDVPPKRRGGLLIVVGALVALLAGLGIAWVLVGGGMDDEEPPASAPGLVIDSSATDEGRIDPGKPLRCFVQGQFVGELTLTACAQRNGVATDALDVGIDESGALAAADQAGQTLTPLPPLESEAAEPADPAEPVEPADPGVVTMPPSGALCWRRGDGRWRRVGEMDLSSCVQTLFQGRCERAGGASYGRHGQQTLRLVAGRVEVSDDNKNFRVLTPQGPDCSIPPL